VVTSIFGPGQRSRGLDHRSVQLLAVPA